MRYLPSVLINLVLRHLQQECIPVGCVPPAQWPYLGISSYPTHAPWATMPAPWEQPCMPPMSNHAHPPRATTHAPQEQPCMLPLEQPCMPTLEQPCMPPRSNHACPPEQPRTPPCGQNVDTCFWKYYLAPTSLRAINMQLLVTWIGVYIKVPIMNNYGFKRIPFYL